MGGAAGAILEYLRRQRDAMVGFLERLTLAESPSSDPQSQRAVRALLADAFTELGYKPLMLSGSQSGGQLYARPAGRQRGRARQLIVGHYDTVWPLGTLKTMPFEFDGSVVKGPGVFDMKGGLAQLVFAFKALRALSLTATVTPLVFLNSDEEIGSRESTRYIRHLARISNRALVLEPSLGIGGAIKTTRKGVGRYTVTVKGRAAHAGLDPEQGASAILELSFVIQKLFALNDAARGLTVNVGTIDGGLRPNVVAPESRAVIDVRVAAQADAERVDTAIRAIEPETPGIELEIEGRIGRPALEPTPRNRALWQVARVLGRDLGLELTEARAGGGSDGNTTSQYTATLDGLGPVGDGAHAHHEQLDLDLTIERAALLALLLLSPPVEDARHE
jgi:glutamate carboxypeptidase